MASKTVDMVCELLEAEGEMLLIDIAAKINKQPNAVLYAINNAAYLFDRRKESDKGRTKLLFKLATNEINPLLLLFYTLTPPLTTRP